MSDNDTLRQAIAEEESRLARIEKERAEALARLQKLMSRLAAEISAPAIPFEVDIVEKDLPPTGAKGRRKT